MAMNKAKKKPVEKIGKVIDVNIGNKLSRKKKPMEPVEGTINIVTKKPPVVKNPPQPAGHLGKIKKKK